VRGKKGKGGLFSGMKSIPNNAGKNSGESYRIRTGTFLGKRLEEKQDNREEKRIEI